ncbi:contractile injection system protein, VgrG/Pvc8 family [Aquincola sp. MAHUQ-54]|uniref:Contractile injection system protein, VgrG/Pvc8 family n=1 Tax=Aquincola agrisoli TaxID=3119538 RepID=A0AAW9Q9S1_9BURK
MQESTVYRAPPRWSAAELLAAVRERLATGAADAATVGLALGGPGAGAAGHVTHWHYRQRLHEPWQLTLTLQCPAPLPADLLGQAAVFWQRCGAGFAGLHGRIALLGRGRASADGVAHRLQLEPGVAALARTRRCRVFQRRTCTEIATAVLAEHGLAAELRALPPLARWRQRTQSREPGRADFESDLRFVQRILADEGLGLWCEPDATQGERLVIGSAGLGARAAHAAPLAFAPPTGLPAPGTDHLLDAELRLASAPERSRTVAYDPRQGRSFSAEAEDPHAPPPPGGAPRTWEAYLPGAEALVFDGEALGVPAWLARQARLGDQRHRQRRQLLVATRPAALWRCGQTVTLQAGGVAAALQGRWLLTAVDAGSDVGPALAGDAPADPGRAGLRFEASPEAAWSSLGWVPEPLPAPRLDFEQACIGAGGEPYARLDPHGRYQVALAADLQPVPGASSRPVRHLRSHAGADHGWHLPLHEAAEVLLSFHGGHPDTPMSARALHDHRRPDPVGAAHASRHLLRTAARNQLRLEDRRGREHVQLATPQARSALQLGHLADGRGRLRGRGWELRTEAVATLRAAQGLLVTSHAAEVRGRLADDGAPPAAPAHLLHHPGHADLQGALAAAQQRSDAAAQAGLGTLAALAPALQLGRDAARSRAPLLQYASAAQGAQLTPGPQLTAAHTLLASAQGCLELASADQVRLYAREGLAWHTEGHAPQGAGEGGARVDVISHGSDEVQVREGSARFVAQGDVVLEFRGARGLLTSEGARIELTQDGVLTITADRELIVEAGGIDLGGAQDWGAGSGSVGDGPLAWWGRMDVEDVCLECLAAATAAGSRLIRVS